VAPAGNARLEKFEHPAVHALGAPLVRRHLCEVDPTTLEAAPSGDDHRLYDTPAATVARRDGGDIASRGGEVGAGFGGVPVPAAGRIAVPAQVR